MQLSIFRANLAACLLFGLLILGLDIAIGGFRPMTLQDSIVPFALLMSPTLVWSAGAWTLKKHEGLSIVWLVASIVLMMVGLLGVYADLDAWRREKLTGQETMHLGAFLAMLLQWLVALPLLLAAGAIRLFNDR
jgi:hypothetical protein